MTATKAATAAEAEEGAPHARVALRAPRQTNRFSEPVCMGVSRSRVLVALLSFFLGPINALMNEPVPLLSQRTLNKLPTLFQPSSSTFLLLRAKSTLLYYV